MAITLSSSNFIRQLATGSSVAVVLPTDVPANAAIFIGLLLRDTTTTTLSSIADPVNGTWAGGTVRQGPNDTTEPDTHFRSYLALLTGSAALTGSSNRTVTVTFSASNNYYVIGGWISSDAGTLGYENVGTFLSINSLTSSWTSNTITSAGAGCMIAFHVCANAMAGAVAPSTSSGEVMLSAWDTVESSTNRAAAFGETYSTAGTRDIAITYDETNYGGISVISLSEPSTASAPKRSLLLGIG